MDKKSLRPSYWLVHLMRTAWLQLWCKDSPLQCNLPVRGVVFFNRRRLMCESDHGASQIRYQFSFRAAGGAESRNPGPPVHGSAATDGITCCPAERGRPDGAILRGGESGEMAPGAHHVVL